MTSEWMPVCITLGHTVVGGVCIRMYVRSWCVWFGVPACVSEHGVSVNVGVNRPCVYKDYSERSPYERMYVQCGLQSHLEHM